MAEWNVTPGEDVVSKGSVGGPRSKTSDLLGTLSKVGAVSSTTSPKGVPSESTLKL